MIFVTLGSQKFQFDRLLKTIDELVEKRIIKERVYAQVGYSNYEPCNYEYKSFLDREEFAKVMSESDLVITHGGTGAIIGAVKKGKKVIAVPRLSKYHEHVDDHQLQIIEQFSTMNIIYPCYDLDALEIAIDETKDSVFNTYISNTNKIIASIEKFIDSM